MKRIGGLLIPILAVCGGCSEEPDASQVYREKWNAGVECYVRAANATNELQRAGEVTNALDVFRSLLTNREYGARAAEVVAKLEYEQGNLEPAANAAQIVLRASPKDGKANRNFTRAIDRLPEWREKNHIEKVLKESQGKNPGAMLQQATHEAHALMTGCTAMATNPPATAVAMSDGFSKRAKTLADVWIPMGEMIAQTVTNEEQKATVLTLIKNAKSKTEEAATMLEDMDKNAYSALAYAEHDLTAFLKSVAEPPMAMEEDEKSQTNALVNAETFNERSWQKDALDYTQAFVKKFPDWARKYEQDAQSDTNKPPFTAEDQKKVRELAEKLEKLQGACVEKIQPAKQKEALDVIRQIRELLPKDKNGGGQSQQNQDQNQQQDKQGQQGQQKQDQQQQQNQDQQQQDQQDQRQEDQQEEEGGAQAGAEDSGEMADEALLMKAQERSDEHKAEKKARRRNGSRPPNVKDW